MFNMFRSRRIRQMAQGEIPNESFHVKISGQGIDIDRLIDAETLAGVMAVLMGLNLPAAESSVTDKMLPALADDATKKASLREFLDEVQAEHKTDLIVAIGHYIMQSEEQPDFSRDEVIARFSDAREPMPKNFWRDFAKAEKSGLLAKVHAKKGRYYITKTGIAALKNRFSKRKT